jgi:hypothetical protein
MSLFISSVFTYDEDAGNYIQAVEGPSGDNQALEPATRKAINNFVIGCKQDGIWTAIKASCILAGARTRLGALTPLVGTAPTSFNFVDGDYNRKTGLVGNGSTKYLDSNRLDNDDPQDNFHLTGYITSPALGPGNTFLIGGLTTATNRGSFIFNNSGSMAMYSRNSNPTFLISGVGGSSGFAGITRSGASASSARVAGASYSNTTQTSTAPASHTQFVFCRSVNGSPSSYTAARLAFYSIGESLDLARLDARVTDLINAFAVTIP